MSDALEKHGQYLTSEGKILEQKIKELELVAEFHPVTWKVMNHLWRARLEMVRLEEQALNAAHFEKLKRDLEDKLHNKQTSSNR